VINTQVVSEISHGTMAFSKKKLEFDGSGLGARHRYVISDENTIILYVTHIADGRDIQLCIEQGENFIYLTPADKCSIIPK
jgi:hypothetical protein